MKRRERLRSMSAAMRSALAAYREITAPIVERWREGGGYCARCSLRCDVLERHHPFRRGKGKTEWKLYVVLPVCPTCHRQIHADEGQARKDGWLIEPKHKDPYELT